MTIDDLYLLLRADHIQAQGIVDTVPEPMLVLDQGLTVLTANRAFFTMFQVERAETIGRKIFDLGNGQWNIPDFRTLLEQVIPRASVVVDYEVRHDFPGLGNRIMLVTAKTLVHPDNVSRSMLLSISDTTDRMHQAVADEILVGELKHRIKNLFASAKAIARLIGTEGRSAADYREAFLARLQALVDAHDIVFGTTASSSLASLVEQILAPYSGRGKIRMQECERVEPGPDRLLSISLILHELAMNAAKHGALSAPDGHVEIGWTIDRPGAAIRLRWTERGGTPVYPPKREGYGSKLIRSVATYNLGGSARRRFNGDGLEVEIVIPLAEH